MTQETPPELESLLDYLKRTRGFDFTAYKRSSLMRRIQKRMQTVGLRDFTDYVDYLEVHPEEFALLFNTILINVTGFFRDPAAWEYLGQQILPRILDAKAPAAPIRVWSAGCASGEEAYTLVMLFAERLGTEAFRSRLKIYATDVDDEALNQARQASYASEDVQEIPASYRERYFERTPTQYVLKKDLRRSVIFGRHDLVQDSPISRIDLLVCRNTLMYFNSESQAGILGRFHFALNDGGFLFVGKAELLLTYQHIFAPIDLKHRVFAKMPIPEARGPLLRAFPTAREGAVNHLHDDTRIRDVSFDVDPLAALIVDRNGLLYMANAAARTLFDLTAEDVGRPLHDLTVSYRPVDLRSVMDQMVAERRPIVRREVSWPTPEGEVRAFEVSAIPLVEVDGAALGTRIVFIETTRYRHLQDELQQSKQALETAYEELQSSNEELETTNEELQSSNEELETTNEELHSTNEELETMNEELQSTNAELETINTELRQRTEELKDANSFLASVLAGLRAGVAVLDRDSRVIAWNERAEDLWGLRAPEVQGKYLMNLDIGLPAAELLQPIRKVLGGESNYEQMTLQATNRRGRALRCTVTCTPLHGDGTLPHRGVILLMGTPEDVPQD